MEDFDQAGTYDKNSQQQRESGLHLMNLLKLEEGNVVLDLGCGVGYLTKLLANAVGSRGKVRLCVRLCVCIRAAASII
jgi:ubiquinone/menaquinone biosynthesis C-methylase UbiE